MDKSSPIWTKSDYIKNRTEFWRDHHGMNKKFATDLAKDDWKNYCKKYGYDETL